jgi:flagellar hook-length control protein FliK
MVQSLSAAGDSASGGSSASAGASVAPAAVVQSPILASLGDSANVSRQPIEPHLMRLDTGPVQVEVLKMVQQGGGQIVLELTPPDQGTYRIDLRLDLSGRAQLVIEGASDSVRTRLEQGESGLREQFAQMGLDLQLNFRHSDQGTQLAQDDANDFNVGSMNLPETPAESRASRNTKGMEQALVHLYA